MYQGTLNNGKPKVLKSGYEFNELESLSYLQLFQKFSWGNTKGSEQLSFAILLEEYGYDFAESNYKEFQNRVISKLDATKDFNLSKKEIEYWRKNSK